MILNSITVILLNYKRTDNVKKIIDALSEQTIKPIIWIWNNSGIALNEPRVNLEATLSSNLKCWPRWFLASYALTEFVMMLDDDLIPNTDLMIENAINAIKSHQVLNTIIGIEGVVFGKETNYWPTYSGRIARNEVGNYEGCVHLKDISEDILVDIVKGRCMILKTESLKRLPLSPEHRDVCDDISVSAILADNRKRVHLLSSVLSKSLNDIPEADDSIALSKKYDWKIIRESARSYYFK